jgi:hypothetical protein
VHDPCEANERRIVSQREVFDQHLEAASPVTMRELGAGASNDRAASRLATSEDIVGWDVEDLGVRVDEAADQPGHAIRSVFGRSRVTHRMRHTLSLGQRARDPPRGPPRARSRPRSGSIMTSTTRIPRTRAAR